MCATYSIDLREEESSQSVDRREVGWGTGKM